MILIEIKIEAHYLKENSQTPQEKKPRKLAFGSITLCFSVKLDFRIETTEMKYFKELRHSVFKRFLRVFGNKSKLEKYLMLN